MELLIVRHGETLWNDKGLLQGQKDIELNENGREMARKLAGKLKDIPIDVVYSSPLKRAYETASLAIGDRDIPIETDDRIKEISFGECEGVNYREWKTPESPYNSFFTSPDRYNPPKEGETLNEVIERATDFVKNVIETNAGKYDRVMVVAHGALNKGMMCYLENHGPETFWGDGLQNNCEATVFEYDGQNWTLKSESDGAVKRHAI